MASLAVCLDQNQNTVSCVDPDCTYGDCGSTVLQQSQGTLCLDSNQNQISCSNPECTYGDCAPSPQSAIGLASVSAENGATTLSVPSTGGPTTAGSTSALLSSIANTANAISKVVTAPPKTSLTFGASGLNISSAGSLFSNPLMLVLLAVITILLFGLFKKK